MRERIEKREGEQSKENVIAHELETLLQEKTGQQFSVTEYHGTYEIDADTFSLTFTIEDDLFEIRSIELRGEVGLGSVLVKTIQDLARENNLTLIASNVLDTAIGFGERWDLKRQA